MNKYAQASRAAQRERRRRSACEGKRRYASRAEAHQHAQATYHCPHCGGWHRSGAAWTFAADLATRRKASGCP